MSKPLVVMSPVTVLFRFDPWLLLYEPDTLLFVIVPMVWLPLITCWGAIGDVCWPPASNELEVLLFVISGIVWLPANFCWAAVGIRIVTVAACAAAVAFLADLDLDLKSLKAIVGQHLGNSRA